MNSTQQNHQRIRDIVIVGGGVAGWMAAAALVNVFDAQDCRITLVESVCSEDISLLGATLSQLKKFNDLLGVAENDFIKSVQGTFKLGTQFCDWANLGSQYFHPFGRYGSAVGTLSFYHYWLRYFWHCENTKKNSSSLDPLQYKKSVDLADYSLAVQAALHGKFMLPANIPNSPLAEINYGYHIDLELYANYLRAYAQQRGVQTIAGEFANAELNNEGFIESVALKTSQILKADFFIDCTGSKALLIDGVLNAGFDDWGSLFLCDSIVTADTKPDDNLAPFTKMSAQSAGWQWSIPLQHKSCNGYVYSSKYIDHAQATALLLNTLKDKNLTEPKKQSIKSGIRKKFWYKNCVAIGGSAGFLESLESTGLHFIQSAILKLIGQFPTLVFDPLVIERYNEALAAEYLSARDFILLHYKLTTRSDSVFWDHYRMLELPKSLQKKIDLYSSCGILIRDHQDLFDDDSWVSVMHGQGLRANSYHPLADAIDATRLDEAMRAVQNVIRHSVDYMPFHKDFIVAYR